VSALRRAGYTHLSPSTLHAYAAMQAWAQAVVKAGTTAGENVAHSLRAGRFETVIGEIGFDTKGDLVGPASFVWYTWRDGTYVPLGE
jgi:branched-chain amino acid transport system substrate-binding protein